MGFPPGENLAHTLVRVLPSQAVQEVVGQAIGAGVNAQSRSFEVTSVVTDRNQFTPTINPDNNSLSCIGFLADVFVFMTQAGTLTMQMGINGSANFRSGASFAIVASTLLVVQGFRIAGSYFRVNIQNTAGAGGTLDFGVYVRSA